MPDPTTHVALSQNEVESLAAKAARGAGLPWGAAEEAGFAAGWLHIAGFDGLTPLLAHLDHVSLSNWHQMRPRWTLGGWESQTAEVLLCPIALGMALSDFGDISTFDFGLPARLLITGDVAFPVLLLPFLATFVPARMAAFQVDLNDLSVVITDKNIDVGKPQELAKLSSIHRSTLKVLRARGSLPSQSMNSVTTPAETLAGLEHLALQTTVPPSARSRADAGAGGNDND